MSYTVTSEDNLIMIAEKYDIPLNELLEFNHLTLDSFLFPGMIINIPSRPPVTQPRPPVIPPANKVYIVRRGDTLWSIARKFNVSVQNIMFINGLIFPFIFPGQRLIIPIGIVPLQSNS